MSVSAYLQRTKGIADELQAAGRKLSPAEFNAIIYRNISSEFHPIITALNLRPEPVSFHELHGQLLAHEILLKSSNALPQANYVARSSSSAPLLPTPSIPPNTQKRTTSDSFKQRIPCQICGLRNHTVDKCRKHYTNYSRQSTPPQPQHFSPNANYSIAGSPSSPQPVANYSHNRSPSLWYPDTAANYHITPDLSTLSIANDYQDKKFTGIDIQRPGQGPKEGQIVVKL
ncbi:hypothetical protein F0562_018331 [Nyssa sinensis]|uniref:Uncharacterized protein n=1 Tax=Nyssa sinensis TaxID=561372 RepID=A0A5J4ZBK9_9ASTE|nr:hypothetical protein F0562_018331 [Nyssa sinensis]